MKTSFTTDKYCLEITPEGDTLIYRCCDKDDNQLAYISNEEGYFWIDFWWMAHDGLTDDRVNKYIDEFLGTRSHVSPVPQTNSDMITLE
jgi:hypothetical protein